MDTCIVDTCNMDTSIMDIMDTCIIDSCIIDLCIIDSCIIDVEVETEVLVNFAWVTWPERPKGAKDEVMRPEGPPARTRGT